MDGGVVVGARLVGGRLRDDDNRFRWVLMDYCRSSYRLATVYLVRWCGGIRRGGSVDAGGALGALAVLSVSSGVA